MTASDPRADFFIVGAPRCGSTALVHYLSGHPQIDMAAHKECHYFADDFPLFRRVTTPEQYAELFRRGNARCCRGEASVYYLYSQVAVANILSYNPRARFVVLVRQPVDMLLSLHAQLYTTFQEDQQDFRTAWSLQSERAAGRRLPPRCQLPQILQYASVGRLGERLHRLQQQVPAVRVHVVVFDDLQRDAGEAYRSVLNFLELPDDGRREFPRMNANRQNRLAVLQRMMRRPPSWLKSFKTWVRYCLGDQRYRQWTRAYLSTMTREYQSPPLPHEFRKELTQWLEDDMQHLGQRIGRDLSSWWEATPRSVTEPCGGQRVAP